MALKLDHHWNDPRNQFTGPLDLAEQLSFSGGAEPYCGAGAKKCSSRKKNKINKNRKRTAAAREPMSG